MNLEDLKNVARIIERIPIYNIPLEDINSQFNVKIMKQKERSGFVGNQNNDGRNIEGFLTPLNPIFSGDITDYYHYEHRVLEPLKNPSRENWMHLYLTSSDFFGDIRFDALDYKANALIFPRIKEKSEKLYIMDLPFRGRYISAMPVLVSPDFKEEYSSLRIDNQNGFDFNSLPISQGEPRFKSEKDLYETMKRHLNL